MLFFIRSPASPLLSIASGDVRGQPAVRCVLARACQTRTGHNSHNHHKDATTSDWQKVGLSPPSTSILSSLARSTRGPGTGPGTREGANFYRRSCVGWTCEGLRVCVCAGVGWVWAHDLSARARCVQDARRGRVRARRARECLT